MQAQPVVRTAGLNKMKTGRRFAFDVCAAALTLGVLGAGFAAHAQEGHPLKGSWIGEWTSNEAHGEAVLVVLDWDGESITGVINPGTHDIAISDAALDPSDWSVRIEADAETDAGERLSYVIEGRIEDLELPNRVIVGTWRHDDGRGAFEIQRQ